MGTENPKQNDENFKAISGDPQLVGDILGNYVPIEGDPAAKQAIEELNKKALGIAQKIAERKFDALATDRKVEIDEERDVRKVVDGHEPDPEQDDPNA